MLKIWLCFISGTDETTQVGFDPQCADDAEIVGRIRVAVSMTINLYIGISY